MNQIRFLAALVVATALAGCGGGSSVRETVDAPSGVADDPSGGVITSPGDDRPGGPMIEGPDDPLATRVIYFDYDQSEVRSDYTDVLVAHGRNLAGNPRLSLRLEGHGDERGSREYNIGLGERRAQAVRRLLLLQGAAPEQLATVSFGEERPAVLGSNEEAWSMNRRVELVYRQ